MIGFMEFSGMKHLAHVIGPVGMALLLNSFASAVCYTMSKLTAVIGPRLVLFFMATKRSLLITFNFRTLRDARSIVSRSM